MKGQVSIELLIIIIILVSILSFLLTTTTSRESEFISTRDTLHAKEIADEVSFSINEVFLAGSGTTKEIRLPPTLRSGANYSLLLYDKAHLLEIRYFKEGSANKSYLTTLLASNITGSFPDSGGTINITHLNITGMINISYKAG